MKRTALAAAVFAAAAAAARDWHAGPFFERDTKRDFWAFRPFYSQEPGAKDFLWPLGTWHAEGGDHCWWRALLAYGNERSFNVFPLWFSGRDRENGDAFYWAFFPFWGHHPHFLTLQNWNFALWPVYMDYETPYRDPDRRPGDRSPAARSRAVLWPIVSWKDEPRPSVGIWPFWGYADLRESRHDYALWPIVTWAVYRADRDTAGAGDSFMVWPLCGTVRRERETQVLFLPPFFSFAMTPQSTRIRAPWPFFDYEKTPARERLSIWPFWERVDGFNYLDRACEERTWRVGWKLLESTELTTSVSREERFSFFPFWTWERNERAGVEVSSYRRLWPFWSCSTEKGATRVKVLDLLPIRHSGGFERNWAPFFTFYSSRTRADGRTRHSLFWNLVTWHTN